MPAGHARQLLSYMFSQVVAMLVARVVHVGCELPPAVVSERDWEREQRKFGPPFMAGRGGGRRGGSSFGGSGGGGGGRGFNANGRGGYSAR
jgi:hypothetical protein